jgi:hypothetical protein
MIYFIRFKDFLRLDPLTLPPPSYNASISKTKVTSSLNNPYQRQSTSNLYEEQKRYTHPQTLARQYDDKVRKKQREHERRMAIQVDTTWVLFNKNLELNMYSLISQHTFSPAPSIPRVFMPPSEVDRAKRDGFAGTTMPRYTVVYDQKDFLQWLNISFFKSVHFLILILTSQIMSDVFVCLF